MKTPPLTQDDVLHQLHEDYVNSVTESGQPLWVCEMYANGPLSINPFPMFSISEGEQSPDSARLLVRLNRLRALHNHLVSQHLGNQTSLSFEDGLSIGYLKGKISILEYLIQPFVDPIPGEINRNIDDDDLPF